MTGTRKLLIAAFLLLFAAAPVMARQVSEAEANSLAATVASFDAAMHASDYETVANTIPPRVLEHIAKAAGVDVAVLRVIVVEQMKAALAEVKLLSFGMDLAAAEHRELPNGEPFVLIPTETVMDAGEGGKVRATSQTLALLDGGAWYLLRVADAQQVEIMRQVYPEFANVEFPTGSTEVVN
jgi:hypothetical protein